MSLDLRNVPYRTEDADRQSASLQNLLRRATMTKFASLFSRDRSRSSAYRLLIGIASTGHGA